MTEKERDVAGRNPLLLLTATLLAATLEVALPNLQVEAPGTEGESLPGEAIERSSICRCS